MDYELRQRGATDAIYADGEYVGVVEPVTRKGGYSASIRGVSAFGRTKDKAIAAALNALARRTI